MADGMKPASFDMMEVSVASIKGDEKNPMGASPYVGEQGQIKQVVPDNKSASPVRRQSSESESADPTTRSKNNISLTKQNQSAPKSTLPKNPRQRAKRSTGGAIKSRLQISTSSKSQVNLSRKPMARCTGIHTCSGCNRPIKDRHLLNACEKYWHEDCLKCDRCHAKLGELGSTFYERANMNLCRQDYLEMFGQKAICAVCDKLIYASEMVMRARDNVYHLECFACQLCGLRFCIGDRFHLCENKIVCQYDFDEHICPFQPTMFDHTNSQQFPTGPPVALSLGSIPDPYQLSVTASQHLGDYIPIHACNSQTGTNQSELASCGYSQSMLLESGQITTTMSLLEGETNNNILEMTISDQDKQTTGERVELTMLDNCEPLEKSNQSDAGLNCTPIDGPAETVTCEHDAGTRGSDRPPTG